MDLKNLALIGLVLSALVFSLNIFKRQKVLVSEVNSVTKALGEERKKSSEFQKKLDELSKISERVSQSQTQSSTSTPVFSAPPVQTITINRPSEPAFSKFVFVRKSGKVLEMVSLGMRKNFIPMRSGKRSLLVRQRKSLIANLEKTGAGGVAGSLIGNKGYDVYAIAKDGETEPALILVPQNEKLKMPEGYFYNSKMLWYVYVDQTKNMSYFKNAGDGLNYYGRAPQMPIIDISPQKESGSIKPVYLTDKIMSLVPRTTSLIFYQLEISYGPLQPDLAKVSIRYERNPKHEGDLSTTNFAISNLNQVFHTSVDGQIPVSNFPKFKISVLFEGLNLESQSLQKTKLRLYIVGWKI